jgi:chromosome segregation ATPase
MAKGKRATNEELCIRYNKERSNLYSSRTRLRKQLAKATVKKEITSINSKINKVSKKIDRTTEKLFKCSKKYLKIKKQRKELLNKINAIKKFLKNNRDLDPKEFYEKVSEINEINEQVRELNKVLGLKLVVQEKAVKVSSFDVQEDTFSETFTIWELRAKIENLVLDEKFDYLIVNGEKYSLEMSMMSAMWAVDDFIANLSANRLKMKTSTPSVSVTTDFKNKTIII